jgi:periplasmic protein TonB
MSPGTTADSDDVSAAAEAKAEPAAASTHERTPDLPMLAERPPRQIAGTLLACAAALSLHGAAAAGLWFGVTDSSEDIGGNGIGRDAIGIDILDSKVLATLQPDAKSNAGSASSSLTKTEGVALPETASVETVDSAAAKPDPAKSADKPDVVIPDFEERPEPPTPDTLSIAKQAPLIEATPAPPDAIPAPKPEASKVASLPNPAAAEAVQGGAIAQATAPVPDASTAAAKAASGRATAYGRDVMAALVTTLPKPRFGADRPVGTVVVNFTVALDGGIDRARIALSSGFPELDATALDAVRQTRFPKVPDGLPANEREYNMPYYFR